MVIKVIVPLPEAKNEKGKGIRASQTTWLGIWAPGVRTHSSLSRNEE